MGLVVLVRLKTLFPLKRYLTTLYLQPHSLCTILNSLVLQILELAQEKIGKK